MKGKKAATIVTRTTICEIDFILLLRDNGWALSLLLEAEQSPHSCRSGANKLLWEGLYRQLSSWEVLFYPWLLGLLLCRSSFPYHILPMQNDVTVVIRVQRLFCEVAVRKLGTWTQLSGFHCTDSPCVKRFDHWQCRFPLAVCLSCTFTNPL